MKWGDLMKRKLNIILSLIVTVIMVGNFSVTAFADYYSAALDTLHYDITLENDGSAYITETRQLSFTGDHEYTLYGFKNTFKGPCVYSDWYAEIDGQPLELLDEPDDNFRPENTFAVENYSGGNTVYIYHSSNDVDRTFKISYKVANAVKLYSDVADFFWNLTGESGISTIASVSATLNIPSGIAEEDFRIWAHGPLNGNIKKQSDTSAYLQVSYVSIGEIVDIRAVMPAAFFTSGWLEDGEGLPAILEKEKELSDIANEKREEEKLRQEEEKAYWERRYAWEEEHPVLAKLQNFSEGITDFFYYDLNERYITIVGFITVWVTGLTGLFGRRSVKSKKYRYDPAHNPEYYRTLPDDRPAPTVDKLLHFYKEDGKEDISRQVSSAILELNLRKLIRFYSDGKDTEIIVDRQRREEKYLPGYLDTVLDFLIEAADGTGRLNLKELKKYVKDNESAAYSFKVDFEMEADKEYKKWAVAERVKGPRFFERKVLLSRTLMMGALGFSVRLFSNIFEGVQLRDAFIVGMFTFLASMVVAVGYHLGRMFAGNYGYIFDLQTESDLALWKAFGRFLDDFTTFDEKELPEFPVWKEYMVYAVAMGKGEKVAKSLAVKYPEYMHTEDDIFDDDYYRFLRDRAFYDALESVGKEVADIHIPQDSDSSWADNMSDSSGGGGGFSSSGGGSGSGSGGDFVD